MKSREKFHIYKSMNEASEDIALQKFLERFSKRTKKLLENKKHKKPSE